MKYKTLLQANFKRHKGSMVAIFIIMMIVTLSFLSVVTIWLNTSAYLEREMERMQYGDITAWTREIPDVDEVLYEIAQLQDVEDVSQQPILYANYEYADQHSDSEGQLLIYEPDKFPYRIFQEDYRGYQSEIMEIAPGDIYLSPTVLAAMHIQVGDWLSFPIARQNDTKVFQVKGTFEDPFMGSSMIGMKSFLISQEDYDEIKQRIADAGIDALARSGWMIHVEQHVQSTLTNAQFNQMLNENSTLGMYVEFMHSKDALTGFMLVLQNVFAGCSMAFTGILLLVSLIIISYSITTMIQQDEKNMAILKTIGYDGRKLQRLLKQQYLFTIVSGCIVGALLSMMAVPFISNRMISFSGILTPSTPHFSIWIVSLLLVYLFFSLFIHIKTIPMQRIAPMQILQQQPMQSKENHRIPIEKQGLLLRISLRQLFSEKKRYRSVCMTTILLVCMISLIGRMNVWLGPNGEGMMDAFNPADLDIGVQLIGDQNVEDMEQIIQQYTVIEDTYALAMPSVSINNIDVGANVISDPNRFHMLQGNTSENADEIVITETIAADMDLQIHDQVTLAYNGRSAVYRVAGIYQCANDMGANIGMSREGFLRIGDETADMWCHHYFLHQPEHKQQLMDVLNERYGGDVYLHENTWPGLFSIITAMHTLLWMMYMISACLILIITRMTAYKLFLFEKRNLAIYKALGYTSRQLRMTFALRYALIATASSLIGIMLSAICTDSMAGTLLKSYGISNFSSHPTILTMVFPGIVVSILFICFAYITSGNITSLDMSDVIAE